MNATSDEQATTPQMSGAASPGGPVLYAWEFGANLGHIGTFLPVARRLREDGNPVHWVVTHPHQAAKLLPGDDFTWLQAPVMPEQRREGAPLNYSDILLRFGYANADDLFGIVVAWRELIRLTGALVVMADHSPTAILAARSLEVPVMLFGSGFFAPPQVSPLPNMRPWLAIPPDRLLAMDQLALSSINTVLGRLGKPPLRYVAELFQVAETSLLTFPELDHYPQRGPAAYWGTLPAAVAHPPQWPAQASPRVFAYLRPESAHFEAALAALHALGACVLVYAPGIPPQMLERYSSPLMSFAPKPVDLNSVAREADAGVTYASPAATIAFLMAGKPVLMIPGQLEQFLFGRRVEEMGAGLLINPENPPVELPAFLRRVVTDPAFHANAQAFAHKYERFDQNEVMTNIVRRAQELAHAG